MADDASTMEACHHPLSEIKVGGEPDWKRRGQDTIWHRGWCASCERVVKVEYSFSGANADV